MTPTKYEKWQEKNMDKVTQKQIDKLADHLRKYGISFFDFDFRVHLGVDKKLNEILKWAKTPKNKRKPAVLNWTSGTERNFGYLIEKLESNITDKTSEENIQKKTCFKNGNVNIVLD